MVSFTNHFQLIADTIKDILVDEWPRYQRPGRFIVRDLPHSSDFRGNDFFRLAPTLDDMPNVQVSSDTIDSTFTCDLIFYRHDPPQYDFEEMTAITEEIKQLLLQHRVTTAWHDITSLTVDYDQDFTSGRGGDPGELDGEGFPIENLWKIVFQLTVQTMVTINEN
jgi:hypothetical protein